MAKKKKWTRFRHKVWFGLMQPTIGLFLRLKYGYKAKKFDIKKNQNYLVIANHTCSMDPFLVSKSIHQPVYYVASDDLLKNKHVARILGHCVAPIPIRKGSLDLACIKQCVSIAKEGGSIGLFPEGNRSFNGKTAHLELSLIKFIRMLKIPLLIYFIDGGYGIDPRWANKGRKSNGANGRVVKELSTDDIKQMKDEEILDLITSIFSTEQSDNLIFKSKASAEYLERVLFICPKCHSLETISSNKDKVICSSCSLTATYTNKLTFASDEPTFKFNKVYDWMNYQKEFLKYYLVEDNKVLLSDKEVDLIFTAPNKNKVVLDHGELKMYSDRFELIGKETHTYYFKDFSNVVNQGKHKVLFYIGEDYFQFNGEPRFSGYKYYLMYHKINGTMEHTL